MRPTVLLVLLSTLVFAQDPGQQAAQIAVQQAQQAQQQAMQTQQQIDAVLRANQQMMTANMNPRVTHSPRFSPRPGSFQGNIPPVTITDATKDAVIYFTTDGSTPTLKSQRYTGPISMSATTTLKAMAIAPFLAKSPTKKGKYAVK
jgi:type II secretory pathway pseudopilin PulG